MQFELTYKLITDIINALENQEQKFVIEAKNNCLIEKSNSNNLLVVSDNNNYYDLPEWNSSNGFKLREDFVNILNAPIAKEELQLVLHSGRGVFKNFREILKKYPEVEKKWFLYKNKIMGIYINNWYNELREIWGLEKLDYIPESDENLIHNDFTFCDYNSETNQTEVFSLINTYFLQEQQNVPEELKQALFELWKQNFNNFDFKYQTGLICRTLCNDFAGCIIANPVSSLQTKVNIINTIYVPVSFRGLGIGTELINMYLLKQKELGTKWILLSESIVNDSLLPLLNGTEFIKIGSIYAVQIN